MAADIRARGSGAAGFTPADPQRRWWALAMICLADIMIILDATIVNVALPVIQRDLAFSEAGLAWVVNAFLLTFGGFMLLGGRAADLYGRRRLLLGGIAVFTLASLGCGLALSREMLIVGRAVQGVGGAIVTAVSLSIVLALFPDEHDRAKAMSIWGFVGSGGGTVGVVAGGLLTQSFNWHWVFLINVPVGILALVLGRILLPPIQAEPTREPLDLAGALTVVVAPVLAVYAIVNASQEGWTSSVTLGCLAAGAIFTLLFVVAESRVAAPLVPLRLFRTPVVVTTNILTIMSGAAFFGWFFFSPLYAQRVLGFDALQTGLTFLPATLTMGALSLGVTARIVARFGPRRPLVVGASLLALGLGLFARAPRDGTFVVDILPGMLLAGIGSGIFFMPLLLLATNDVQPSEGGLVSGLLSMSQQIGGAIGLALLAGIAAARTAQLLGTGVDEVAALNEGYRLGFFVATILAAATAVIAAWQLGERGGRVILDA